MNSEALKNVTEEYNRTIFNVYMCLRARIYVHLYMYLDALRN